MMRCFYMRMQQVILCLCLLFLSQEATKAQEVTPADSLSTVLGNIRNDTAKVNMLLAVSGTYTASGVAREFYYANEALGLSEKMHWDKGTMLAEELLGDCYYKVLAYNDAIVHLKHGVSKAEKLNRTDIEASCLEMLFRSYKGMNDLEHALLYAKRSLDLAGQMNDPLNVCRCMRTYALCISDLGRYTEAIPWYNKALAFTETHLDGRQKKKQLANLLNTEATTYVKMNKNDSALYCLRIADKYAELADDDHERSYILSTFCDVYESAHQWDSAILYGEWTLKMGEALANIDLQQHYCETLSRVYEYDHKPELALVYHKKFDSLITIQKRTQQTIEEAMQLTKINIEQQAARNELEQRSAAAITRNQRTALVATLTAMVTLIVLIIFIYRNLRQKQRANKTISLQAASLKDQNQVIEKALKEKEMLLKETHHRVKNNLQLISSLLELQAENIEDESARSALRTAQRRVLSIATVHSKLYGSDDDEAIEFSAFASDLFARLYSAFGSEGKVVRFNNAIPSTFIPLNTVVLLGVILNELITNSFKHAFTASTAAAVTMELVTSGTMYMLTYRDNGPGLPEGLFNADGGSLGFYLVRRLSKQLKGSATYKFEEGSTFTIIFQHGH